MLPERVERVFAAGPRRPTLLHVLAPERMIGWARAPRAVDKPFLAPAVCDLPATGRLTGRGGAANIETAPAAKPDLILDVGAVDPTYVSLADRFAAQTGLPYALTEGGFAETPETLRTAGAALGVEAWAEALAALAVGAALAAVGAVYQGSSATRWSRPTSSASRRR